MKKIVRETELLKTQKKIAEGQLLLVQKQISEAELKLQKLSPANNQNE